MFENISPFEVQTPGSEIWKNPGSENLVQNKINMERKTQI